MNQPNMTFEQSMLRLEEISPMDISLLRSISRITQLKPTRNCRCSEKKSMLEEDTTMYINTPSTMAATKTQKIPNNFFISFLKS